MKTKAFCINCGCDVEYRTGYRFVETTVRGINLEYQEKMATCPKCGDEIYVPEINDYNAEVRNRMFENRMAIKWIPCEECIYSSECSYAYNSDGCYSGERENEPWEEE